MLYELSYEATDVGSRSIVGSYVPRHERNECQKKKNIKKLKWTNYKPMQSASFVGYFKVVPRWERRNKFSQNGKTASSFTLL